MTIEIGRVALLWRGDREARNAALPQTSRLRPVVEALAARNIHAESVVYRSLEALRVEFPRRLRSCQPSVLERNRGNGGQGVWKVERLATSESGDTLRAY